MVLSHTQKLQSEHNCSVLRGYKITAKIQMQKLRQQKMNGLGLKRDANETYPLSFDWRFIASQPITNSRMPGCRLFKIPKKCGRRDFKLTCIHPFSGSSTVIRQVRRLVCTDVYVKNSFESI